MSAPLNLYRRQLEAWVRANCVPVTLSVDEMVACLDSVSGVSSWASQDMIRQKIQEAADRAVAGSLGLLE